MKGLEHAVEIFKLTVDSYSQSANAYDSLAEAYLVNGNKELAIKNYERSLELNPANSNAVEMLKNLDAEELESDCRTVIRTRQRADTCWDCDELG